MAFHGKGLGQGQELVIRWRKPNEHESGLLKALEAKALTSVRYIHTETTGVTRAHNRKQARLWVEKQWCQQWHNLNQCRQTKIFFPTPNAAKSKELMTLQRRELGLAIQFLTGHCFLMRHQRIIDGETSPSCRLCSEEEETPEHLFFNCPWVIEERDELQIPLPTKDDWTISQVRWILSRRYIEEMMDPELAKQRRSEEEQQALVDDDDESND